MLSQKHLERITKQWHADYGDYLDVSKYIQEICVAYRKQHPHVARIIFSREPPVKTLASITQKIDNQRQTDPTFDYEQLVDIIALTVLCPYESDVKQFIAWMKEAFEVHTDDANAHREYASGHIGYHYVISPTMREILVRGKGFRKRCEIQIKTILQEAFDAKSHDLAYKPGVLEVGEDLKRQFFILSNLLRVIDGQSEFLKKLILQERRELELRRSACLHRYLRQEDTIAAGRDLMIDIENLQQSDVMLVSEKLRKYSREKLSVSFCKFASLCAVKLDHDFLKDEAVSYADMLVEVNSGSPQSRLVRASVKWVLGRCEEAISDVEVAISSATELGEEELAKKGKNNFIYFVADWKLYARQDRTLWSVKADEYVREFVESGVLALANEADWVGLHRIAFGTTAEEIEEGRDLIRRSKATRTDDLEAYLHFYRLHEYAALHRLLRLA